MTETTNALKAISKTDSELRVGNYIVLFGGRDLTAFGTVGNKKPVYKNADGSAGEFFGKSVDLESPATKAGKLPVDWEHGRDTLGDEVLGFVDWATKRVDEVGVFVERVLNRRNEYIKWIESLIEEGLIGTSSEADPQLIDKKSTGEIVRWGLKRDTLTVTPMEPRMISANALAAMKALKLSAGNGSDEPASDDAPATPLQHQKPNKAGGSMQPCAVFELDDQYFVYAADEAGEATGDPLAGPFATADEAKAECDKMQAGGGQPPANPAQQAAPPVPTPQKGTLNMPDNIQEVIDGLKAEVTTLKDELKASGETVKALKTKVDAAPARSGGAAEARDPNEQPFRTAGQQLKAIREFTEKKDYTSESFNRLKAVQDIANKATGLNEQVGSEGEFLLQPTFAAEILKPMHEEGPFTSAVRRLPVGENSNSGYIKGVDETSRATGSRWGGIRGYRLAEGGTKTASKPAFRDIAWKLKKYAVLMYSTDELLNDFTQLAAILQQGAAEELNFMANDDILNGAGTGGPTGILNSPALVSVTKETGQAAATVVYENIVKMWQRMPARNRGNAVWYINSEVEPQLDQLALLAGTASLEPRYVTYDAAGVMKIKGRPVVVNEFNAALGTVGDIVLADPSEYLFWEKAGNGFESSVHVAWTTDETCFRTVYRCDGLTALNSAITPYKGTATQSPFVALATRA